VATNEKVAVKVTRNDQGLSDGPIEVTLVTGPAHGWAWVHGAKVGYRSYRDFVGSETLVYRITDRDGDSATGRVLIQVGGASSAGQGGKPVAKPDRLTATSGKIASIDVLRNDTGAGTGQIKAVLSVKPSNGTAWLNPQGLLKYRSKAGFSGTDTLRYRIIDGQGRKSTAGVTIQVAALSGTPPTDASPVAKSDSTRLEQGGSVSIDVLANDSGLQDGPVSVSLVGEPNIGSAKVVAGNRIQFTAPAGIRGAANFSYKVVDASGDSAVASVSVDVTCASCTTDTEITLSWGPHSEPVTGYWVVYGPAPSSTIIRLSDLYVNNGEIDPSAPSVSYAVAKDLGAKPGEKVCFKVGAFSNVGKSKLSTPVCTVL